LESFSKQSAPTLGQETLPLYISLIRPNIGESTWLLWIQFLAMGVCPLIIHEVILFFDERSKDVRVAELNWSIL
jgi:hypothetical protein